VNGLAPFNSCQVFGIMKGMGMAGKYSLLEQYLRDLPQNQETETLTFEQIEGMIKSRLPSSAYGYPQWWEHETEGNHRNTRAWTNAGWKIETLNLADQWVKLVRMR
jgi:hypothetical protein